MRAGDIYSMAITMFEMLMRVKTWQQVDVVDLIQLVSAGERPAFGALPEVPEVVKMIRIIDSAWAQDYQQRPTAAMLLALLNEPAASEAE